MIGNSNDSCQTNSFARKCRITTAFTKPASCGHDFGDKIGLVMASVLETDDTFFFDYATLKAIHLTATINNVMHLR